MRHTIIKSLVMMSFVASASIVNAATLKISHVRPQGAQVDLDIKAFAEEVKTSTNGDTDLRIFAASALGDYTTVQEKVSIGAVDMAIQPAAVAAERKLQINSFPYLAENYEHAKKIYGPNGVVRNAVEDLLSNQDVTVLAAYPVYFGGISLNTDAVSPGDANAAKGIKVRVPGIKSFQMLADSLGYIASPIPFSEAFTSVQTGVVDGVIGSGAEGYYASFRDVTKTFIRANTHFEIWYLMINSETFNDLDDTTQSAMQSAAANFEESRWNAAEADQVKNEEKLAQAGATIVVLTDEELAAAAKKVRAEVWPEVSKDIDAEWANAILEKAAK